jgi:CBS domain containing-hemolysin-like protein
MSDILILTASVGFAVVVSALCSLMEASLYAVPLAYVRHRAELGFRSGRILSRFKDDMGKPIASILIINTISNTAGAAIAGWAAAQVFGSRYLALFSVFFTLAILYCSEIIPKLVGVVYCKVVAGFIAFPLFLMVKLTTPLVWVSEFISRRIKHEDGKPAFSAQEFISMTALGTEEGALDHFEGSVITNVVGLDRLFVKDVLTPRVVVFRLEEDLKVAEVESEIASWNYSRVPIFSANDRDNLFAYVTQRDIYRELLRGNKEIELRELSRPLKTVPELLRVDKLLLQMFAEKEMICAVVDEHGGLAGIITLEDIIEEIVGREIVDEYDTVSDLRTFAKILRFARTRKKA